METSKLRRRILPHVVLRLLLISIFSSILEQLLQPKIFYLTYFYALEWTEIKENDGTWWMQYGSIVNIVVPYRISAKYFLTKKKHIAVWMTSSWIHDQIICKNLFWKHSCLVDLISRIPLCHKRRRYITA